MKKIIALLQNYMHKVMQILILALNYNIILKKRGEKFIYR